MITGEIDKIFHWLTVTRSAGSGEFLCDKFLLILLDSVTYRDWVQCGLEVVQDFVRISIGECPSKRSWNGPIKISMNYFATCTGYWQRWRRRIPGELRSLATH